MMIRGNLPCGCGCGQNTFLSQVTRGSSRKGRPNLYIRGHQPNSTRAVDITGVRFGKLLVISRVKTPPQVKYRGAHWLIKCDCGKEKIMQGRNVRTGISKSCGCSLNHGEEAAFHRVWNNYRTSAKKRGFALELSKEEVRHITSQSCFYCGIKNSSGMATTNGIYKHLYNGIDRIDNTEGYTLKNSRPCCYICNQAKSSRTESEFFSWIKDIYEVHFERK